jgi:hypothetical protein
MSLTLRLCRYSLFLVVIFVFSNRAQLAAMEFGNCSDVCGSDSDCGQGCLIDYDTESTCGDYGTCYAYGCDSVCGLDVDCTTSCVASGDTDCGDYGGGEGAGQCYGTCGDTHCESPYETFFNCPADCPINPGTCPDSNFPSCWPPQGESCGSGASAGSCESPGCCEPPCSGSACGGTTRTCDDTNEACGGNSDCCSGEKCVSIAYQTVVYIEGVVTCSPKTDPAIM